MKKLFTSTISHINAALHSPFAIQLASISLLLFFIMGFRPLYWWGPHTAFGLDLAAQTDDVFDITEAGFLNQYSGVRTSGLEEVITQDDEGNEIVVLKAKTRDTVTEYSVRAGDTVSRIAHKFGLKVRTVLWSNNLTAGESLATGTELRIPPVDGVFYAVQRGENLSEIAVAHNITNDQVLQYNTLNAKDVLKVGQEIFLPGAQKVYIAQKPEPKPEPVAKAPVRTTGRPQAAPAPRATSNGRTTPTSAPVGARISSLGYKIRRPTKGVLTQGYHRGHTALDIASSMNTPIYAAAPGKVIISQDGWNGGYGRYIILDHGNGVHTLYAHNNVRKVAVGDWVEAGELIALMGNTGRVFGRTGIHSHFELRLNGRKVNPANYF